MQSAEARRLFDANAETYDGVNSIVSLGLDARWRDWAARRAVTRFDARVLDAFAGTGHVGLRAAELGGRVTLADVSPKMLAVASRRAAEKGLCVDTILTDLTAEPLGVEGPFESLTVMWGLRYLGDPIGTLRRLAALVAPGGRVVVVDFVEPSGGVVTRVAAAYFFRVLPWIAGALAGRRQLYGELVATTHSMGSREHLASLVGEAGLEIVEQHAMGFGLVVGLVAVVPTTATPGDIRRDATYTRETPWDAQIQVSLSRTRARHNAIDI
jgi:demethylmenaquinone methyltransferase/2-methoxy-6-polyprenyl-1,4-benzoquinol methylase